MLAYSWTIPPTKAPFHVYRSFEIRQRLRSHNRARKWICFCHSHRYCHIASSQLVTKHLEGFQVSWQGFKIPVLKATTKLVIMKNSNHQFCGQRFWIQETLRKSSTFSVFSPYPILAELRVNSCIFVKMLYPPESKKPLPLFFTYISINVHVRRVAHPPKPYNEVYDSLVGQLPINELLYSCNAVCLYYRNIQYMIISKYQSNIRQHHHSEIGHMLEC